MSSWHSPQSIFALGHRAVKELFTVPVQVQEKIDGSFFAFGLYPAFELIGGEWVEDPSFLELKVRSKGAVMIADAPQALFKTAVDAVKARQHLLHPGWQYRGEVVAKPKHNALHYDRTPKDFVILFDVCTEEETYLSYSDLCKEAERLNFEVVPQLAEGLVTTPEDIRQYLETTSILGGQKIEGVVIKPLQPLFGQDKKMLFGKFVSEAFKEVHRKTWGESNPGPKDIISAIAAQYATGPRYNKAVIHLMEAGVIENSPRDIGLLIKAIPDDVYKECVDDIKDALFRYAWPHIRRMIVREVPQWYKDKLLVDQFEKEAHGEAKADTTASH